jgi:hypothetical protein
MDMDSNTNWKGCYGEQVSYDELNQFMIDSFVLDDLNEKRGSERFGTNVIGHTGIGKTSLMKQLASKKVDWHGQQYDGFEVRSVPIAQFEEMGDLHGLPEKRVMVRRAGKKMGEYEERWIPMEFVEDYKKLKWEVNHTEGVRTMYAAPEWVPQKPGPCIINLDDWNRANGRIIKGCMQFLQEYGLMSWKLPPGCHITLTMNPDEQDYFVTAVDSAVLQRLRSVTLKFDAKEWSVWATGNHVDPRVVSYVLAYPEMVVKGQRNSPRSISEFGQFLQEFPDASERRMKILASSLLEDDLVASFFTFLSRDFEMVISPESILRGDKKVFSHLKDLMSRDEKRVDVVGVTMDRLFAYLMQPHVKPEDASVENVRKFIKSEHLNPDFKYVFVDRLNRASSKNNSMDKWFMGDRDITKMIMELV